MPLLWCLCLSHQQQSKHQHKRNPTGKETQVLLCGKETSVNRRLREMAWVWHCSVTYSEWLATSAREALCLYADVSPGCSDARFTFRQRKSKWVMAEYFNVSCSDFPTLIVKENIYSYLCLKSLLWVFPSHIFIYTVSSPSFCVIVCLCLCLFLSDSASLSFCLSVCLSQYRYRNRDG